MEEMVGLKEGVCETTACKLIPNPSTGQPSYDFPSNVKKKKAVKCEHFSIRGYVADIRRRDCQLSWPFSPPRENEGLADLLPPLHIPNFRFWECQKCVQTSDASENAADVSSLGLKAICVGRKNDANTFVNVNGLENCPRTHSSKKENRAITMPDITQDVFISKKKSTRASDIDYISKRQSISERKRHKVNFNSEACESFGFDGTNCGITANGAPNEDKTLQYLKNADVVSFGRTKFRPYESSDEEDADIHKLHDPSQITNFKKRQKFRLLSDILREENSGTSAKVSNSKWGTNSGDVSKKIDQIKSSYQPDSLVLCDQTDVGNGIEEKNKKRKALEDENQDLLLVRSSTSLAKSHFYQRDKEEIDAECSHSLYSNGESHLLENGKRIKASQNHLSDKETVFQDSRQQDNVLSRQGFTNVSRANYKIVGKEREVQKHSLTARQTNTNQTEDEPFPMEPKDLPVLCNFARKKKNLNQTEASRNRSKKRPFKMGESEPLDGVSLQILELLANSRHDCHCQEAQNADQIKSRVSEKTYNAKDSENILLVRRKSSNKIRKTSKNNSFDEKQMLQSLGKNGSLASSSTRSFHFGETQFIESATGEQSGMIGKCDGDKFLNEKPISYWQCGTSLLNHQMISHPTDTHGSKRESETPCACTQKKIGNSAWQVLSPDRYANRYMPATELLELMDAGMCPQIPQPEKSNYFPIKDKTNSKKQLPFRCGPKKDLSMQEPSNCLDRGNGNLGMCSPIIYPISSRNEESQIVVSETVKSARKEGKNSCSPLKGGCVLEKPSCGNEELGKKHDSSFTNVVPLKLELLSLEHRLTYYPVATLQRIHGKLGIEICSMNRNPANFTAPGPGNRFMVGSRELRIGILGRPRKSPVKVLNLNEHARN